MCCSRQLAMLILMLCRSTASHDSRRSLSNIFNRTPIVGTSNPSVVSPTSQRTLVNKTSNGILQKHDEVDKIIKSRKEASDMIVPKRRRRLGVGAKSKRQSDKFIDGNESMHRFFDKMLMSMTTEIPTNSPGSAIPPPFISPITTPSMILTPSSAPSIRTATPTNTSNTQTPVVQFVCDPPITIAKREELILSILNDITPESEILSVGTSQNKAFNWLVNIDELKLCPNRNVDIIQRFILAITYFSLGGDDWLKCSALPNSNNNTTCIDQERYLSKANICDWFNITCSIDGNVTGIILDDNNLVGFLPKELRALDKLVNVSFYSNTMVSGSIPSSYGSLSALKRFDISNNVIMGTIPSTICDAKSLHYINLKMNVLVGTIPTCIGTLGSLSSLSLDRNILTGRIPTHVIRLTSLENLSLSDNSLTGVIPTLGSNSALRELSLQQNILSGGIPTTMGSLTNLESLNLFFNKLNGTIPAELGNLSQLENLFLHFNELTGTMPSSICELRDLRNGALRQLTSDCGLRGRIVCPVDCCTACF